MGVSANATCTIYDMFIAKATDEEIAEATGIHVEEVAKTINEFLSQEPTPEEIQEYEDSLEEGSWSGNDWYEDNYEEETEL